MFCPRPGGGIQWRHYRRFLPDRALGGCELKRARNLQLSGGAAVYSGRVRISAFVVTTLMYSDQVNGRWASHLSTCPEPVKFSGCISNHVREPRLEVGIA